MNTETAEAPTVVATLAMSGISKSFGGVAALTDVSLEVLPGEVHALLGENGAGKSTLMNVATGTIRPDAGAMVFQGQSIDTLDPREAARLGIAFVHQHPAVMPDLTVYENLLVALPPSVFEGGTSREETARALLARVGLRVHLSDRVETLSVAQEASARDRQGARGEPLAPGPRRADSPAGRGVGRTAVPARPRCRRLGHLGRLHHAPPRRGPRARRPRDGPARRSPAGHRGRGRDLGRRAARADRRPAARLDLPAQARCGRERRCELRPVRPHRRRLQQRLARGAPR